MVAIRVLNDFVVIDSSGEEWPLSGRAAEVLAVLVTESPHAVSTERIHELVWAGRGSIGTVQSEIHTLRRRFGLSSVHQLVTRANGYALLDECLEVDALHFLISVEDGSRALQAGELDAAHDAFRKAKAIWRTPPFESIAPNECIHSFAARLENAKVVALQGLLEVEVAKGRSSLDLIAELEDLAEKHPHRERLTEMLILSLYRASRQTEALRRYDNIRRILLEESGLSPGVGLQSLHERILRQDPTLLVAEAQSPSPGSRVGPASSMAVDELLERLGASRSFSLDQFTISAHNVDEIYRVDRVAPDHEARIAKPAVVPGGSGANTAVGLARLGFRTAVAGIIGNDDGGGMLRGSLQEESVDCSQLLVGEDNQYKTGRTLVFTDPVGRRTIYVDPGVNEKYEDEVRARPNRRQQLAAQLAEAKIVHFTSFTGGAERALQIELVQSLSPAAVVSLNPGALYSSMGLDRLDRLLSRVNVLFLYEQQLATLVRNSSALSQRSVVDESVGADLSRLFEWRARRRITQPLLVVIKRHLADHARLNSDEYVTVACGRTEVETIVGPQQRAPFAERWEVNDTTGVGDAMAAAVQAGLLCGATLSQCADLAHALAMSVSQHVGARPGLLQRKELAQYWTVHFHRARLPQAFAS